jgi:hypothetical protein
MTEESAESSQRWTAKLRGHPAERPAAASDVVWLGSVNVAVPIERARFPAGMPMSNREICEPALPGQPPPPLGSEGGVCGRGWVAWRRSQRRTLTARLRDAEPLRRQIEPGEGEAPRPPCQPPRLPRVIEARARATRDTLRI